jgi:putative spermidine/putrescine transport system permease protein
VRRLGGTIATGLAIGLLAFIVFVTTQPLLMFNASMGGNYQIASITARLLLVPSIGFMLVVERFLKANVLAMVGR